MCQNSWGWNLMPAYLHLSICWRFSLIVNVPFTQHQQPSDKRGINVPQKVMVHSYGQDQISNTEPSLLDYMPLPDYLSCHRTDSWIGHMEKQASADTWENDMPEDCCNAEDQWREQSCPLLIRHSITHPRREWNQRMASERHFEHTTTLQRSKQMYHVWSTRRK